MFGSIFRDAAIDPAASVYRSDEPHLGSKSADGYIFDQTAPLSRTMRVGCASILYVFVFALTGKRAY